MLLRFFPKKVGATLSLLVVWAPSILGVSQAYAQVSGAGLNGTAGAPIRKNPG